MAMRIRDVVEVPKPSPPTSRSCDRRSPRDAPSGRVMTYAHQKAGTGGISPTAHIPAIAAIHPANTRAAAANPLTASVASLRYSEMRSPKDVPRAKVKRMASQYHASRRTVKTL